MQITQCTLEKPKIQTPALRPTNLNIPNVLTSARIMLIPIFLASFSSPSTSRSLAAAVIFGIAAVTDFFDGYLARKYGQVTTLGKLLDPIADKLLVTAGLVILVQYQQIEAWLAFAIIARELSVTGLRAVAAAEGLIIPADTLGKVKTFFQICGILLLSIPILPLYESFELHSFGVTLLYMSLMLGVVSGIHYLWTVLPKIGIGRTVKK
ncbi:MAG: CDP-diacylglycerol--glycerol-3-phosphate 3-phosphatidyltransferase [Nitrospirales bacterium]|nr:MAG: CDP-diacylglycerol--glycerol-3-phosphate 3-phosphatidyltransferase [Nitrospirales bacterium]